MQQILRAQRTFANSKKWDSEENIKIIRRYFYMFGDAWAASQLVRILLELAHTHTHTHTHP